MRVYGFLNIMFKILEEEKPEFLAVAFDVHAPTFRHELYKEYKGTRKPMPEELRGAGACYQGSAEGYGSLYRGKRQVLRRMISWEPWRRRGKRMGWRLPWYRVTGIFFRLPVTI